MRHELVRGSVGVIVFLVRETFPSHASPRAACNEQRTRKSRILQFPKGLLWCKFRRGYETISFLVCPMRMTWFWLLALWREWLALCGKQRRRCTACRQEIKDKRVLAETCWCAKLRCLRAQHRGTRSRLWLLQRPQRCSEGSPPARSNAQLVRANCQDETPSTYYVGRGPCARLRGRLTGVAALPLARP